MYEPAVELPIDCPVNANKFSDGVVNTSFGYSRLIVANLSDEGINDLGELQAPVGALEAVSGIVPIKQQD